MDLSQLLLVFGLLFLGLAALTWAGSGAVLRQKAKFAEATLASLLMVVLGGSAAAGLTLVYRGLSPVDPAKPLRSYELLGQWVTLDVALVSLLGLGLGYMFAFNMTLGGRWSRRILLALLAAVVTPVMLLGAEMLVHQGSTAVAMAY